MSFTVQNKVSWLFQRAISGSEILAADRILFPKIFYGLNLQLKKPNRSFCVSLHKYAVRRKEI